LEELIRRRRMTNKDYIKYKKKLEQIDKLKKEAEEIKQKFLTDIGEKVLSFCEENNLSTDDLFEMVNDYFKDDKKEKLKMEEHNEIQEKNNI